MNLIKNLLAQGHEVHTIAPTDDYTSKLVAHGCLHHKVRMDSRGANPIKDSALIFELYTIYKRVRPDIILHFTIKPNVYGTLAASMLKIPVINNVCGLGTVFLKDNLVSSIAMFLYKASFRFANKVFFQNSDDLRLFIDKKLVLPKIVDLVPGSGIDLAKFSPADFKRNKKFTFLLISRLITDKGVLEYIEAVKKLKQHGLDARFQVLGSMDPEHKRGIQIPVINEWIRQGTIEYLGTTDNVRQYIHEADCVVLPCYSEGTRGPGLEAASSSKPIIATDVPGCNHVVKHNYTGLLCKLKDADDLAEKMKMMASMDDEHLRKFGENGRCKVESEFNESLVIDKYLETIANLKRAS
jgi:glycosyltransferase involved in cell wall biosynthesis